MLRVILVVLVIFSISPTVTHAQRDTWIVVPTTQRHIIPVTDESDGTEAKCPDNMVMTGRMHTGDENGPTEYECAALELHNPYRAITLRATIEVKDRDWTGRCEKESVCAFLAADNRVITGRMHTGDENGPTRYETGIVTVNDTRVDVNFVSQSPFFKESSGQWWKAGPWAVMIGRLHVGDENGDTMYQAGRIIWTEQ